MTIIKAVFWDFGGVFTTSPFAAFKRFEEEHGLPADFLRRINAQNQDDNAWARLERNTITLAEFDTLFEQETRAAGHAVPGRAVIPLLYGELRPAMLNALKTCNKKRLANACLTNNIALDSTTDAIKTRQTAVFARLAPYFDVVVESSKVGVRKPEPAFYRKACALMNVDAGEVVYLDDLGVNLKPARAMGMTTIKVTEPAAALRQLEAVLDFPLLEEA